MDGYNFYEDIGQGELSSSTVVKARHKHSTQHVAIVKCPKSLTHLVCTGRHRLQCKRQRNANRLSSFQVENNVFALYKLRGCHDVVQFHNWYTTGRHVWQVLELCDGGALSESLTGDGAFPERCVQVLGAGILAGLVAAHSRGVIMAGLHHSAVLLTSAGRPKVGASDPRSRDTASAPKTSLATTARRLQTQHDFRQH